MTVAEKILRFYRGLKPPAGLPSTVEVLNPYKDEQAMELCTSFYQKYYQDQNTRIVLFGINPGRFGGGITGVPFSDPEKLETYCDLPNPFDKRKELSSSFIYEIIEAFGGPEIFYKKFYITGISPLGYIKDGKNLNYYDISDWKTLFHDYAVEKIREQMAFPLSRKVAISIGQGQNLKFLKELNKQYGFFETIEVVPHPRWVMQYNLKNKQTYIDQYLKTLYAHT